MSDWIQHTPKPVLIVDFPWDPRPGYRCLNCYEHTHINAKSCRGCGITFTHITTAAVDQESRAYVKAERPDLEWREVQWG